ncbi:hypothetical protein FHX44_111523 [Pseudonocardia hierapolitana]|uniref:PIN like domain-containing protein n=1 Tax=Pseudonocardia hierapolitana TaxID=1128676 RepID=A0A561SLA6_9PSEU|nr:PIN-like domain-containing protein [Pseudonocardia hierapolitana]TWF75639.1 hypothetical protein FHX44_111523 [Pseudonocardia hierapolitana]
MSTERADGWGMYDDFRGYRVPDEDALSNAIRTATVVLDANVLLSLYRYNSATRDDLLDILRRLGERLWIPHQVMREFWRNRLSVIVNRGASTKQVLDAFSKSQRSLIDAIDQWARTTAVLNRDRERLISMAGAMYGELNEAVEAHAPASVGIAGGAMGEEVLKQLEELLDGRVGAAPAEQEWRAAIKEGAARVAAKVPPGYLDSEKADSSLPEGAAGDYLVWKQSVDEIRRRGGDLLIVTGDVKEDWWWRYQSEVIGPRPELVSELFGACNAQLFMMRPTDLLRRSHVLHVHVNEESIDDAERVGREVSGSWTPVGVISLLERLDAEGWEHADVIREAATLGGRIPREVIYEVCGYGDDRMLRGFTRPAARITRDLQMEGIVAEGVPPVLTPLYEGGVKAIAFEIPAEVVTIVRDMRKRVRCRLSMNLRPTSPTLACVPIMRVVRIRGSGALFTDSSRALVRVQLDDRLMALRHRLRQAGLYRLLQQVVVLLNLCAKASWGMRHFFRIGISIPLRNRS